MLPCCQKVNIVGGIFGIKPQTLMILHIVLPYYMILHTLNYNNVLKFVMFSLMYLIICKLLVIPEIHSQVLLRMHILSNCTKQQITHRNILAVIKSFYPVIL